jgi:hypothetical protein
MAVVAQTGFSRWRSRSYDGKLIVYLIKDELKYQISIEITT